MVGLPEFYRQYSSRFMVAFDVLVLIRISVVLFLLGRVPSRQRMRIALWIAFYSAVPLAVNDSLYCGLVLGFGFRFVVDFWYLTVYYFIPWFLAPAVVWSINRRTGECPGKSAG